MKKSSPRMRSGTREAPVNSSPAVAANAEGEEIEVLESTDVLPVAPEDVSLLTLQVNLQCNVG